jgi:hypothetical protein
MSNEISYETPMKEAYFSLPANKNKAIRDAIVVECGITKTIFYNWMDGKTPVPKLCKIVVSQHFGISECDLFPGINN